MTKQEAAEKIRKLLALSTSPNEAEAKLALAKAQEFMMRWAIEEHEALGGKPAEFIQVILYEGNQVPYEVKITASIILHEYFNVKCIRTHFYETVSSDYRPYRAPNKHQVTCFGTRDAIDFAIYTFNFLLQTYDRLWSNTEKRLGLNHTYRRRYIGGLVRGFADYLESQQVQSESECKDLIVIGKELTNAFEHQWPKRQKSTIRVPTRNEMDAVIHAKGFQDGQKIRVSKPVDYDKKERITHD